LRAGFAEIDITPPLGTHKIGWLVDIVSDQVLDPLFARAALLEAGGQQAALIQLDTLSVRWTTVTEIRRRCSELYGLSGGNIMVAATHNHAGPAVANAGEAPRDDAYVEVLVDKVTSLVGEATSNLQAAEVGFASTFEFDVAFNRRVITRDGTVRTHGSFEDPNSLCMEGPIDPELAVMAARDADGRILGAVVNFACHPTHHGPGTGLSAGFPGALAKEMKERGCPVAVFLNGACGNMCFTDPTGRSTEKTKEEIGRILAEDAARAMDKMSFSDECTLACRSKTVFLPFREATEDEIKGTTKGAQRFVDPSVYERTSVPAALKRIRRMGVQPAQVQAVFIDDHVFVGVPAEYFAELGLRIKEQSYPRRVMVVSHANGMVGYVPGKDAFKRGGYETTFGDTSRLAPEAGDILADAAIELINQ